MKINLICVGSSPTNWIKMGCDEYLKRFPNEYKIKLIHIPITKRNKNTSSQYSLEQEKKRIDLVIEKKTFLIVLDSNGQIFNSQELSKKLNYWRSTKKNITLLIGGPDGIAPYYKDKAQITWSLSNLTFPHHLVKIIILEQLYRATSILNNHPYHRT